MSIPSASKGEAAAEEERKPKTESESHDVEQNESASDENDYPSKKVMLPAIGALYLAVFLVSIDRTILGTATPSITNEFNSFGDIAWYESGFLLPFGVFQLSFGRVYTFYSTKWGLFTTLDPSLSNAALVLIALVAIFEVGSIVAAAAPSSNALIIGRVITGVGAAGISAGGQILLTTLVPLESRPIYIGFIGAIFGLASILGPLLGGYLTSITWRWCFWINVPIGGVSLVALAILCPSRPPPVKAADSWLGKIKQLDPLGFVLIAPSIVCLLFALQWAGVKYAWNDGRIIALLVIFGVFGGLFIAAQIWRKDKATVPPKIFLQRSVLFGGVASLGFGSELVLYAYYLPVWFQAIQNKSPSSSGLSLLPIFLSTVICVISSGVGITLLGYYTPFSIVGGAITIVGAALITTLRVDAGPGQWIGYQVVVGVGQGLFLQVPNVAVQTVLRKDQVPIGLTLLNFIQTLGGAIFVAVAQTLLSNRLIAGLEGEVEGFDPASIANQGATALRSLVSASQLPLVLEVYNGALQAIWYLGLGLACLMFVASFGIEWKSVKKNKSPNTA